MTGWRIAALMAPAAVVLFLGTGFSVQPVTADLVGVDETKLPAAARALLPIVEQERQAGCPAIPLLWLVAQVQVESSWDARAYSPAGAAGLLQFMPASWQDAAGGDGWAPALGPPLDHPVWDPQAHLRAALPWMCANLALVTAHLQATGKPTAPLTAMAVCHIAGCSRVTGSTTGVPAPGEAGCGTTCAAEIRAYLDAITGYVLAWAAPPDLPDGGPGASARPFPGGPAGCVLPDPTGTGGCVTAATAWMLTEADRAFPDLPVACYRPASWGEHGLGRACDFVIGRIGAYPGPALVERGWQFARWLQANAEPLHIQYLIWHGRIWSVARTAEGWRPYDGAGGLIDTTEPTGGHYDHVHVSVTL